jgi:hypothetical protein
MGRPRKLVGQEQEIADLYDGTDEVPGLSIEYIAELKKCSPNKVREILRSHSKTYKSRNAKCDGPGADTRGPIVRPFSEPADATADSSIAQPGSVSGTQPDQLKEAS